MLKKPDLNKPVFTLMPSKAKSIEARECPQCKRKIEEEDFRDMLSKREYTISGLCQVCQDRVFGGE